MVLDSLSDAVTSISNKLICRRLLLNILWGVALCSIIASGFLMAGAIMDSWVHRAKDNAWHQEGAEKRDESDRAPAPDWSLSMAGIIGSLLSSLLFGVALRWDVVVNHLRGSLEYTTLMLIALKRGKRFKYARNSASTDENQERKLAREIHQLRVEAGLVGWSAEEVDKQIQLLREAFEATQDKQGKTTAAKKESEKLFAMLKRTLGAMPLLAATSAVLILFILLAGAVLAWGLTFGLFHMPDEDDDAVWVEITWQIVNFSFTIVAVWKGPQRARLIYHLCRRNYEVRIDESTRSLLVPGVLLTRRQVIVVAALRMSNVVCQYLVNFFQWAWFRRCWQEAKEEYRICSERPGWGILVFLIPAIICDNLSNMFLHSYITKCEYSMWPTSDESGLDPGTSTQNVDMSSQNVTVHEDAVLSLATYSETIREIGDACSSKVVVDSTEV